MNDGSDKRAYREMRTELQELEHRLSELKARLGDALPQARPRGRIRARLVAFRGLAAIGCVALVIATLAASQSLTVDPSGVVKVGALQLAGQDLAQTLSGLRQDVNSKLPLAGGTLGGGLTVNGMLNEGNSDIYFTKTDHNHSGLGNKDGNAAIENARDYNGLMILGRQTSPNNTRIVRMWDRVGIGGGSSAMPQVPLDVKGEIRGRLWSSGPFVVDWNANQRDVAMTLADHSVCFLIMIRGGFAGFGEQIWIEANSDRRWHLKVNQGGAGHDLMGQAVCIGAPDDSW
jgi:hypothetical protein